MYFRNGADNGSAPIVFPYFACQPHNLCRYSIALNCYNFPQFFVENWQKFGEISGKFRETFVENRENFWNQVTIID